MSDAQIGVALMLGSVGVIGIIMGFFASIANDDVIPIDYIDETLTFGKRYKVAVATYIIAALVYLVGALMFRLSPTSPVQSDLYDIPMYLCAAVVVGVILLVVATAVSWAFFTLLNVLVRGYYEKVLELPSKKKYRPF